MFYLIFMQLSTLPPLCYTDCTGRKDTRQMGKAPTCGDTASMILQNSLADNLIFPETCPPPHTLFWRQNRVGFAQTFFVTFQNWQSNIHPHFTLCGGKKWNWVWTSLSQPLFFHSWLNTFCHLSREQPRATLWMPSRRNHLHHYPHI